MAVDYGLEVLIDSSVTTTNKAKIVRKILLALEPNTLSVAYATTYTAGAGSTNEVTLTVGGASPDFGIRIIIDETAYSTDKLPNLVQKILRTLAQETLTIAHAAAYAAGTRAYNLVITVS